MDGTWGSHIDTIKVIQAYVLIRRRFPRKRQPNQKDDWLFVPEIHTTFKALRWVCDDKQIFSDGSFLHTMFLTIFYALALIEVYESWEPAECRVDQLYDDVVWASPVRTTPERSKRLKLALKNRELQEELERTSQVKDRLKRVLYTIGACVLLTSLFIYVGKATGRIDFSFHIGISDEKGEFFHFAHFWLALLGFGGVLGYIWRDKVQQTFRKINSRS